jgi:hypothetical protein
MHSRCSIRDEAAQQSESHHQCVTQYWWRFPSVQPELSAELRAGRGVWARRRNRASGARRLYIVSFLLCRLYCAAVSMAHLTVCGEPAEAATVAAAQRADPSLAGETDA